MIRNLLNLTQGDVADKIGRTRPVITNIEITGKGDHENIKKICEVFNIDLKTLEDLNESDFRNLLSGQMHPDAQLLDNLKSQNKILNDLVKSQDQQIRLLEEKLATYKKKERFKK